MSVRERDIEEKMVRHAKSRGCLVYKFSSPYHSGVSDRIFICPGGRVIFYEVKKPGEKPTALQQKFLDDVEAQGAISHWGDNINSFKLFLDLQISFSRIDDTRDANATYIDVQKLLS